jgi:hypothetical protein
LPDGGKDLLTIHLTAKIQGTQKKKKDTNNQAIQLKVT